MPARSLLASSLLAPLLLAACGASGEAPPASAPRSFPELMCSGDLPDECGIDRTDCEATAQPIYEVCLRSFAELLPADPTLEMRERAGLLAGLCSLHVYRQRRALDGHACGGEDIEARFRPLCIVCAVAAGTVRVADEPSATGSE